MKLDPSKLIGVKRDPAWSPRLSFQASATTAKGISKWTGYTVVTDNQHNLPACVGFATANWVECMLRKTFGKSVLSKGQQIDGESIWRRAREMFWKDEPVESGGIYMDQGFRAAIDLEILPPDTDVRVVDPDISTLCDTLVSSPVLQGTMVFSGWNNPDPANGQIPLVPVDDLGGHGTCILGVLRQDGFPYVLFQNSWGSSWGYGGYGLLTAKQWSDTLLGPLSFATLPENLESWSGWKAFVVTK